MNQAPQFLAAPKEDRMLLPEFLSKCLFLATACAIPASPLVAQNPQAPAPPATSSPHSFDVATIKPHQGITSIVGLNSRPDGINASAATLSEMMVFAYRVRTEGQVSGGADWGKIDRYDVEAKMSAEDGAEFQKLSSDEMKERRAQMLRTLLEDRFHLQTHFVTKEVPTYELIVAKGGPKMKDAATDTNDHMRMGQDGKPLAGTMWFLKDSSTAQGYAMGALANFLSQPFAGVGRPVVDKTGLTGTYNFTLDWSPQMKSVLPGAVGSLSAPSEDAPSIFTALQELGLKLQPATGPEKIVVIDHVERPSEN